MKIFYSWKKEAGDTKEAFIPLSTFEDFCWSVFAVVGVARKY
jgi:hypothetical protein